MHGEGFALHCEGGLVGLEGDWVGGVVGGAWGVLDWGFEEDFADRLLESTLLLSSYILLYRR